MSVTCGPFQESITPEQGLFATKAEVLGPCISLLLPSPCSCQNWTEGYLKASFDCSHTAYVSLQLLLLLLQLFEERRCRFVQSGV
jgi:hypothetical protein